MSSKKTLVSGIQPSGVVHIGNYFGSMKQYVDLQEEYDSYFFIADYHALTTIQDGDTLRDYTMAVLADFLAIGLDPEKATIFRQSAVPERTELTWIFNCLMTTPWLERAHAYKDKVAKGKTPNVGLFDYPILMAADILLPQGEVVPVGEDQRQHLEMAREVARRFNDTYEEIFTEPEALIKEEVAVIPGIDGQKMSKSYGNTIPLFAEKDELKDLVMSIVTDSKHPEEPKDPEADTVFALHKLFTPEPTLSEIRAGYEEGGLGYGESKQQLLQSMENFIAPLREKRATIIKDQDYLESVLNEGGKKARAREQVVMKQVRDVVGLSM